MSESTVVVLGYHKIGAPPRGTWTTWNYVPIDRFESDLGTLVDRGWEPIDAARFVAGLESAADLPARAALITFDDGYRSMGTVAAPILARHGVPAVVFVPTGFVGDVNRFDEGAEPTEPIATWDELRALADHGVSVQSHGVSHRAFAGLDMPARAAEFGDSRVTLERELGRPVRLFAFPFGDAGGDPDATAAQVRDAGYAAAFLYRGGAVRIPAGDSVLLPRIPVGADTDLAARLAREETSARR